MSRFLPVTVRERAEGSSGLVEPEEFNIFINVDEITLFNSGEDPNVCFVRLTCGATLCVALPFEVFVTTMLEDFGIEISEAPVVETKKKSKKKAKKK